MRRPIAVALLAAWLLLILDMTLRWFPQHHPAANPIPFRSIVRDGRIGSDEFVVNFLGNLAAFTPLGALLPTARSGRTSAWHVALTAAALSASIEAAQYASGRRVADVDDVILNTTGALIGYAARFALFRR